MDRDFILHPDRWPNWPFLPLKRTVKNQIQCCVLVDQEEKYILYKANMFNLPDDLTKCKQFRYATVDALLADGWIVD